MKILGINYLSESSVCLIENGELKFAISEERINRIKNWYGNPFKAVKECLSYNKIKIKDIDYIASHGTSSFDKNNAIDKAGYTRAILEIIESKLPSSDKKFLIKKLKYRLEKEKKAYRRNKKLIEQLKKKFKKKIEIYDHHKCHAASAAYFSRWRECMVLTMDGYGDSASSKLFKFKNNKLNEIKNASILSSLGYFYGSITKYLGFRPQRHEGKVLGLAAYGNSKKVYKIMFKLIYFDKKKQNFSTGFKHGYLPLFRNEYFKKIFRNFKKKDIAAAAQKRLEDVVLEYIKNTRVIKSFKIALAGGVFANVKLNQKIKDLKFVKDIFIFPNMGDGGLSVGAAALSHVKHTQKKFFYLKNVYLGKSYNDKEIKKEILSQGLSYVTSDNMDKLVATKLHKGKVVAIFNERMEFGPRALGNRSILSRATDKKINKILNKKLKRTEFMPFAPITLENQRAKMFYNTSKGKFSGMFMTLTYHCKKKMISLSPAAVHIDDTARPQFINRINNPKLYNILNEYYKISKIPNLINTSFNMHEEPIVYSPNDAIRAFLQSKIDYLYIGNFLLSKKTKK